MRIRANKIANQMEIFSWHIFVFILITKFIITFLKLTYSYKYSEEDLINVYSEYMYTYVYTGKVTLKE